MPEPNAEKAASTAPIEVDAASDDTSSSEALRLVTAFHALKDKAKRGEIIELTERYAAQT